MVDVLTVVALALVGLTLASYVYRWRESTRDSRVGDGLFLVGVALVLFADEVLSAQAVDVAVAVGGVLLVAGLGVKVIRPFTPARTE
ncbi:hypothetical protein [Halorarius litoreus]|uniref:hypothetical protein n=1 Tax=Halorarius litoreus TaxID=2962676 RepID=UPI0020CCAE3C|nr:hypothetical protein [Halorarius litoreus]